MAFVGMKYVVAAKLKTEKPGQLPEYEQGMVVGRGIEAVINYNRANNTLRADDADAESDNSVTGGTLQVSVDDMEDSVQEALLSQQKTTEDEYDETGEPSPYIGLGYMRARRHKGVSSMVAYWIWKCQLGIATETATTKGEQVQWQTPGLSGNMMAVQIDSSMVNKFRRRKTFTGADAEAQARAWLNKLANITEAAA